MSSNTFCLTPFLAESLSLSSLIYPDIDRLYELRKQEYYLAAIESEYYNLPLGIESSLNREIYFKRCLGMIEYSTQRDDQFLFGELYSLLKKAYKKTYNYFKKFSPDSTINFRGYMEAISKYFEDLCDDEINANVTAALIFSQTFQDVKEMEETLKLLDMRLRHSQGEQRLSFTNMNEKLRASAIALKRQLPKDIFRYLTSCDPEKTTPYQFLYDLENLSLLSLSNEKEGALTEQDLIGVLSTYVIGKQQYPELTPSLKDYVIAALQIIMLQKLYNSAKASYFRDNAESTYPKILKLSNELKAARLHAQEIEAKYDERSKLLLEKISALEKTCQKLQKENKGLHAKMDAAASAEREVIALREFAYSHAENEMETTEAGILEEDLNRLRSMKGVIIGGQPFWHKKLKDALPSWTFLSPDVTLNVEAINQADAILFFTSYLNHKSYYAAIEIAKKHDIKIGYLNSINIPRTLQDIGEILL